MASFQIQQKFDSPSWAAGDNFGTMLMSKFEYQRYSQQTLIYCNHPEDITQTYLGDNGYCINQATVSTREALLYASCNSSCGIETKFVVHAYNPGSSNVSIQKVNSGFECTTNWSAQIGAYEKFFAQQSKPAIDIPPKTGVWIENGNNSVVLPKSKFEALMKYQLTGPLVITVYLCTDIRKITVGHNPKYVPFVPALKVYCGTADAFYISDAKTLKSANLFVSYYNSAFYGISQETFSQSKYESNPIKILQGKTASEYELDENYSNVGNWGLQYAFSMTLQNNQPSSNVKFRGYIISNKKSHCAGIMSGGVAVGKFLGPDGDITGRPIRWMFCETQAIAPGNSITLDYQYMHLSRGNARGIIQWEACRV